MNTKELNLQDLKSLYVKDAMSQANVLYNLCLPNKLNFVTPTNTHTMDYSKCMTFFRQKATKNSKFKKITVPIDVAFSSDCKYHLDIYKLCSSFNAQSVGNIDIMFFDKDVIIDEILLLNGEEIQDKCNLDMLNVFDYLKINKITKDDKKTIITIPFFFKYPEFPLLKSKTKISIKINYAHVRTKAKIFADLYIFESLCHTVFSKATVQTLGMNYFCDTILEKAQNIKHTIDLNFKGRLSSFIILLQPFNKTAEIEFNGALYQNNKLVTLFSPVLNDILVHERFHVDRYNKYIYISTFSLCSMLGATRIIGYHDVFDENLTFEFQINSKTKSGSVFMQIWAPKYEIINMPLKELLIEELNCLHKKIEIGKHLMSHDYL